MDFSYPRYPRNRNPYDPVVDSPQKLKQEKENEKKRYEELYEESIQDNIIKIKNIYRLISKQQHDSISDDDMPIDDMVDISELKSWIKHVKINNPNYDNLPEDQQDRLIAIAMEKNRIPTPSPTKGGRKTRKIKKRKYTFKKKISKKKKNIKKRKTHKKNKR